MKKLLSTVIVSLMVISPVIGAEKQVNQVKTTTNLQGTQVKSPSVKQTAQPAKYELGEYSFGFAPSKPDTEQKSTQDSLKKDVETKAVKPVLEQPKTRTEIKPVSNILMPEEEEEMMPSVKQIDKSVNEVKTLTKDKVQEIRDVKPVSKILMPEEEEEMIPSVKKIDNSVNEIRTLTKDKVKEIREIKPVTTEMPITRTVQPVSNKPDYQQNVVKQMKQIEAQEKTTKVINQNKKSLEAPQKAPYSDIEEDDVIQNRLSEPQEVQDIESRTESSVQKELEKYNKNVDRAEEKAEKAIKEDIKKTDEKIKKNKSKSEKKVKYDKDKPPVPFKIVPKYYEGGVSSTVERL